MDNLISLGIVAIIVVIFGAIGLACCYFKSLWDDRTDGPHPTFHTLGKDTMPRGTRKNMFEDEEDIVVESSNRQTIFAFEYDRGSGDLPKRAQVCNEKRWSSRLRAFSFGKSKRNNPSNSNRKGVLNFGPTDLPRTLNLEHTNRAAVTPHFSI